MSLIRLLWLWTFALISLVVCICYSLLRQFNFLGSEFDTLIQWLSLISTFLAVFVALRIQEQIQVRAMLLPFILFALGFFSVPFVVIGVLMLKENLGFNISWIFGVIIAAYLLLYMRLWFYLKKKGVFNRQNP